MLKTFALLVTIALFAAPASAAAPVKARVLSGIGILLIRNGSPEEPSPLALFKEPSLGRIAGIDVTKLPVLSQTISQQEGITPVIVTSKKSGWYRIIYDEGERDGWVKGRSSYQFHRWEELLSNSPVSLIGGLRKEFYLLRKTPDNSAESISTLGKGIRATSLQVEGDWLRVSTDSQLKGWIRWRDENSRLVIAIPL